MESIQIENFSDLLSIYDYFVFDIHGVVHDGVNGYPDAIECVNTIAKSKPVFFVSNNPRPCDIIFRRLISMGISQDTKVYTSGDLVLHLLEIQHPQKRIFHFGGDGNVDLFANAKTHLVESPEDADLIVLTLNVESQKKLEEYQNVMDRIVKEKKPVICANPDKTTPHGDSYRICAGTTAEILEGKGLDVLYAGKPEKILYDYLYLKESVSMENKKGLMIGDTIETDVLFAKRNSLDSLLVLSGVTGKMCENSPTLFQNHASSLHKEMRPNYYSTKLYWK